MFELFLEDADISIIFEQNRKDKIGGLYLGS